VERGESRRELVCRGGVVGGLSRWRCGLAVSLSVGEMMLG
jgi:hypothetical protein